MHQFPMCSTWILICVVHVINLISSIFCLFSSFVDKNIVHFNLLCKVFFHIMITQNVDCMPHLLTSSSQELKGQCKNNVVCSILLGKETGNCKIHDPHPTPRGNTFGGKKCRIDVYFLKIIFFFLGIDM